MAYMNEELVNHKAILQRDAAALSETEVNKFKARKVSRYGLAAALIQCHWNGRVTVRQLQQRPERERWDSGMENGAG